MDLLSGSDSEEGKDFTINKKYARNYKLWRKKEERQKLLDKYGEVPASPGSSSSDEGEIDTTSQMDKDWLRAYAVVRFQQPRLYKEGETFFHDSAKPRVKENKTALTLKDHERKFILEKGGVDSDDDDAPAPSKNQSKSYYEEQEEIKQSFKEALRDSDNEAGSDEEDNKLLVKKIRTAEEKEEEENDYLAWLKGEKEKLGDEEAEAELAPLKAYWNDPNLSEKEKVLRDYIFHNGYKDQEDSADESDSDEGPDHSEEEEFLKKADDYEHDYNFRHEEPGGTEIKSYPRLIETSMREKNTKRAEQRQRRAKRNEEREAEKQGDIRLLQRLQKEEMEEKMQKLRNISMNPDLNYDLDADFDPEEHNKIMEKYFNESYYGDDAAADDEPHFDHDEAIDDDPDDWWHQREEYQQKILSTNRQEGDLQNEEGEEGGEEEDHGADDPNFIMDADYDPSMENMSKKQKKKKEKKLSKTAKKKILRFDPTKKSFDEYINEYLKDKISTLPFSYRGVVPNNFGLSTVEILTAEEKELNSWVSVKKMSWYRTKEQEMADVRNYEHRANNWKKKFAVLPSLWEEPEDQKKKGKKKKTKINGNVTSDDGKREDVTLSDNQVNLLSEGDVGSRKSSKTKRSGTCDDSGNENSQKPPAKKKKKGGAETSEADIRTDDSSVLMKQIQKDKVKMLKDDNHKVNDNADMKKLKNMEGKVQKKKKKKQKNKRNLISETLQQKSDHVERSKESCDVSFSDDKMQATEHKKKRKKKSKLFISHSNLVEARNKPLNKKKLEGDLKKLMSASRLSKFGIGVDNESKKQKKKKKK